MTIDTSCKRISKRPRLILMNRHLKIMTNSPHGIKQTMHNSFLKDDAIQLMLNLLTKFKN